MDDGEGAEERGGRGYVNNHLPHKKQDCRITQKYSVSVQTYDFQSVQRGKEIKDWGRNNSVSTPRAKHKLAVSSCFPKEPMNMNA